MGWSEFGAQLKNDVKNAFLGSVGFIQTAKDTQYENVQKFLSPTMHLYRFTANGYTANNSQAYANSIGVEGQKSPNQHKPGIDPLKVIFLPNVIQGLLQSLQFNLCYLSGKILHGCIARCKDNENSLATRIGYGILAVPAAIVTSIVAVASTATSIALIPLSIANTLYEGVKDLVGLHGAKKKQPETEMLIKQSVRRQRSDSSISVKTIEEAKELRPTTEGKSTARKRSSTTTSHNSRVER